MFSYVVLCYVFFFFFKQKTAYEMRISDWSSDVCSSDLLANADLRVYEMALEEPTGDISKEPAMSEIDGCHALAYGMMAVEPGIDVLSLGEMGIGNTTTAAALCHGLFGGEEIGRAHV